MKSVSPSPLTPAGDVAFAPREFRFLVVDDHPIFRHGIIALIEAEEGFTVCAEAGNSAAALEAMRRHELDAVLMDISLPGSNGVELIKMMKAERPELPILVVSMHDESIYALRALRAGALGYVMKGEVLTEVVTGLRKILRGEMFVSNRLADRLIMKAIRSIEQGAGSPVDALSDREREVLTLLGQGLGTRQAAEQLGISVKTAETHRTRIKEKLGFRDSNELVRFSVEWVALSNDEAASSE